jgi:hypothetical protein
MNAGKQCGVSFTLFNAATARISPRLFAEEFSKLLAQSVLDYQECRLAQVHSVCRAIYGDSFGQNYGTTPAAGFRHLSEGVPNRRGCSERLLPGSLSKKGLHVAEIGTALVQ